MGKRIFIIVGVVIVLATVAVFAYLVVFGTPQTIQEVFTDFDTSSEDRPAPTPQPTDTEPSSTPDPAPTLDLAGGLQQLTTRPVAGYGIVSSDDQPLLRYVERGTGHVYEIDLEQGEETRISNTTIPRVHNAQFSPDGDMVLLQATTNNVRSSIIGRITSEDSQIEYVDLPEGLENPSFSRNNTLRFTLPENDRTVGYTYSLETDAMDAIFSLPLQNVVLHWSDRTDGAHYVSNRPDSRTTSYLYRLSGNNLLPTDIHGQGLTVARHGDIILFSRYEDDQLLSYHHNLDTDTQSLLSPYILPEKCDVAQAIHCGSTLALELQTQSFTMPESWYMGEVALNDALFSITQNTEREQSLLGSEVSATRLIQLEAEAGRRIDVTTLQSTNDRVVFINRIDDMLWHYEI